MPAWTEMPALEMIEHLVDMGDHVPGRHTSACGHASKAFRQMNWPS
jgi:hypothetical protein